MIHIATIAKETKPTTFSVFDVPSGSAIGLPKAVSFTYLFSNSSSNLFQNSFS